MAASPNPGGQHRRLIRTQIGQWVTAQRIRGVDHVYPARPLEYQFDEFRSNSPFSCLVGVSIGGDSEDFEAFTGPTNPGGMLIHYQARLHIVHRAYTAEVQGVSDDEDDYDRIYDGLKDALRRGRDLGRPDVVLGAGTWPRRRSIVGQHDDAYQQPDGGAVDRWGVLMFTVAQYLP